MVGPLDLSYGMEALDLWALWVGSFPGWASENFRPRQALQDLHIVSCLQRCQQGAGGQSQTLRDHQAGRSIVLLASSAATGLTCSGARLNNLLVIVAQIVCWFS